VYTIQSGDTLLGIALQFGVTADTIRAANPNLTSDTLQIGQQIVIPAPLFDTSGNPLLPTSTPLSLPLPSPVCTITPTEHILCLGTVHNALDFPVERVAVQVRLLRADGSLLIEGSAGLEQVLIPAGQSAPYSLLLQANWRDYAGAVAALTSAESAARDQRFIPIEVEDNQGHNESGAYSITARFHNTSEQIAHIGRIIAALYDADGRVISYRVIALKQDLLPDAVYAFNFTLIPPPNTTPATHTLYVEALRANTKP
jgi:LysM repeat protein